MFVEWIFSQLFQKINLKNTEVSSWQIFFKLGVLKSFILFTRKHLCWSPEGWRPVTLYKKKYSQRRCYPVNVVKCLKDFYWNIPCWLQESWRTRKLQKMQNKFSIFLCVRIKKLLLSYSLLFFILLKETFIRLMKN